MSFSAPPFHSQSLNVGLIQTTLDHNRAWVSSAAMEKDEEERAISEIRRHMTGFQQESHLPDVVLLPELAVPRGFLPKLASMAKTLQSIVVAGLDYRVASVGNPTRVVNEAAIIVPSVWRGEKVSSGASTRYIGKTYPAPGEEKKLETLAPPHKLSPVPDVWLFNGGRVGKFGVAICYDFLDLDRLAMYRGQVQHLFILAYNADITSFHHAAEGMARMVFCNVVVCNCGYFGGSLALSPYYRPERRTVYRHSGSGLATSQVISLPVSSLQEHQQSGGKVVGMPEGERFKSLPPGYTGAIPLTKKVEPV